MAPRLMNRPLRPWLIPSLVAVGAGLMLWGAAYWLVVRPFQSIDFHCDDHPPIITFRKYFGAPPPGVSDIRATGYSSLGGGEVYMRFTATPESLARLTEGWTRLTGADAKECLTDALDAAASSSALASGLVDTLPE